ncbi:unnamed protein product [Anisakis simplex]|uniref:FATC domain-containing protein n=1 Tax=Anisakis simplex TaxID=6269 RepID=A0A3P6RT33_ANISI|nr:unnamed protein product [Anisakis simplex]VDK66632.1 unnamed protein product [Anisakis simplex]
MEGRDFMSVVSNGAVATDSETAGITGADGGGDLVVRKPMTPAEQADMLIREAVSLSNLALMYEGWTAWV